MKNRVSPTSVSISFNYGRGKKVSSSSLEIVGSPFFNSILIFKTSILAFMKLATPIISCILFSTDFNGFSTEMYVRKNDAIKFSTEN